MKIKNILLIPMMLFSLASCNKNDNKITIAEVTHSLFYAPLYIAKNAGFFNDVGLDIDIVTTPGSDKVMASLLSKDAQIGLMGNSLKRWKYTFNFVILQYYLYIHTGTYSITSNN